MIWSMRFLENSVWENSNKAGRNKPMPYLEESYDVVVVGAGHAGCEAALACARLGLELMGFFHQALQ